MYSDLDPVLHSQVRLAVVSILMAVEEAEFNHLKEKTNTTAGNLSFQIGKLEDAGYVKVKKTFRDNYPLTVLKITPKGKTAFEEYVRNIKKYLNL
ncbi:MAG TPA: transcriptional regulator [Cyclobacteriaceae bacterium]|nr:transcriptional regulator [Cyclobacteriaceae bacterium]